MLTNLVQLIGEQDVCLYTFPRLGQCHFLLIRVIIMKNRASVCLLRLELIMNCL